MIYRRGKTGWYKFSFGGFVIRESAHTTSEDLARRTERKRRYERRYCGLPQRRRTRQHAAERTVNGEIAAAIREAERSEPGGEKK
ncbi:MAG: hypothetical protein KGL39_52715 [Patescibacteria group bacterium]|nr:hypothetical protein [Patescibacteria group bacterium]